VMDRLRIWMDQQVEDRNVEPNSALGEAIGYMRKRWDLLTGFLYIENAPLDNNIAERALKKAILNRKNAYFYRNDIGVAIGDIFISIIQTCVQAKVNAFEYITALQKNALQNSYILIRLLYFPDYDRMLFQKIRRII
jgi:transposase